MAPHKAAGERKREQMLLSDPMVMVISPTMVKCRQCNREIKLSTKCAYDNFHWKIHRDRCIKATRKKALIQLPVASPAPQKSSSSPDTQIWALNTPPLTPSTSRDDDSPSHFEPSPDLQDGTAPMPSTEESVPQTDRGGYWCSESLGLKPPSQPFSHSYPFSNVESATYPATPPHTYSAVDDYIFRVHPESFDRPRYVTAAEIKNWNWSQLRPPRFNAGEDYDSPPP